jgi:hypothetical protein
VAFPIVRTWKIVGNPKAHNVLSPEVFSSAYQTQSALLRPVSEKMRSEFADLEIVEATAGNAWIAIGGPSASCARTRAMAARPCRRQLRRAFLRLISSISTSSSRLRL